ncbi:MAG: hypothetical protein A3F72_03650 [Bacteroidetes bacterium RIFCSPLOWO2_12_FULL_35_15]|nr:MAG: hypothetical protein A3F72_03650 [Bacteroidetes bacterium RIFCSPLOWO2_12_FULL_35_15]
MKIDKLITYLFIISALIIIVGEFFPADFIDSHFCVCITKFGQIIKFISYSLIASIIFYWIAIYLLRERKKTLALWSVIKKTDLINSLILQLYNNIYKPTNNFNYETPDFNELNNTLKEINPDLQIESDGYYYENWHIYLQSLQGKLINLIRSIYFFHEYLPDEYLQELTLIENKLLSEDTFDGRKKYSVSNLTYATLSFQEIFIHNLLLQKIYAQELKNNDSKLKRLGKEYREKHGWK